MLTPSDAPLTLLLLGDMAVARTPHAAPAQRLLAAGKPVALLAYLSAAPDRAASREHVVDLLWADLEPDAARHALRQAIWYLKRRTGEALVAAAGDQVALAPHVASDVGGFLAAVERRDYAAAVAVYRGDFIPGFAAPGAATFEHWADAERQRLRAIFARAAEQQVRHLIGDGRGRDGVGLARRVRDGDPLSQAAWRLVLEALLSGGDGIALSMEVEALRRMLADEEAGAEPATASLLRFAERRAAAATDNDGGGSNERALVAELVGREAEFARVMRAAEGVREAGGAWLHLHAPAGLGKSRLLADVEARLRTLRFRVRAVRARPAEREIAWSLCMELAGALASLPGAAGVSAGSAAALVELVPALRDTYRSDSPADGDGSGLAARRIRALAELLATVSEERPLALVVDDLHWGDPASLEVIGAALDRAAGARVLALTAARQPLAWLGARAESAVELPLPPLEEAHVLRLLSGLGDLPAEPWATTLPHDLVASTGGSPLLVVEALQLALEQGALRLEHRRWSTPAPDVLADTVGRHGTLAARLTKLPAAERGVLLALAVAGAPVPCEVVASASPGGPLSVTAALKELERRGLAYRDGAEWAPAHDEIARAVLEGVEGGQVTHASRMMGRALLASASGDARTTTRAFRLLAPLVEARELGPAVRAWVSRARERGRRDPVEALVRELAGDLSRPRLDALVAEVPWSTRVLGTTGGRAAAVAAALLVLLPAVLLGARLLRPAADAELHVVVSDPNGGLHRLSAELRLDGWRADEPVRGELTPVDSLPRDAVPDPSRRLLGVATVAAGGSAAVDLLRIERDGRSRRLSTARGDDVPGSFSPDGEWLAIATDRFRPVGDFASDVSLLRLADDSVRRLTGSDARDMMPRWSPDGSRIAFVRRRWDRSPDELCWVTVDGALERCATTSGAAIDWLVGWLDTEHLVLGIDRGTRHTMAIVRTDGTLRDTLPATGRLVHGTQDARWIVMEEPGTGEPRYVVHAIDGPRLPRRLQLPPGFLLRQALILTRQSTAGTIARLATTERSARLPVGARNRLRAVALDAAGATVDAPVLQWSTSDSLVASIDTAGVLLARREGRATVRVSAGGWRRDSLVVTVEGALPLREVIAERWTGAGAARGWRFFGVPPARLVPSPGRHARALHLSGDGAFTSGVYNHTPLDTRAGAGVEVLATLPITAQRWQVVALSLVAPRGGTAGLMSWDGRSDPVPDDLWEAHCTVSYPTGESPAGRLRVSVSTTGRSAAIGADTTMGSGRPVRWRVQILADGRCGIALDGRVVAITEAALPRDRGYHPWIGGNSVGTDLLVHSVDAWEGVRPDIEWVVPE